MSDPSHTWWKSAVVYQIYPVSFFDSNGDGIGDLNGISAKLDYLEDLGVDVLWLCPIYRSPQADMGYDISDYRDIDPQYGTLADWDNLLRNVHDRGMKLMMDLVANHTSDEHDWFIQSRSGKDTPERPNPKRDWYIWRPPKYDSDGTRHPPNNWKSVFQGSAWDYDETSGEYYLHLYVSKQPDLNWENPEVREAIWQVMRFWIDRGCDGFRMDVINLISKVPGLPDAPVLYPDEEYQPAFQLYANGPRVHEFLKEMHTKVLSHHDLITVGETPFTHSADELAAYVLPANHELNMVFQFEHMDIDAAQGTDHSPLAWRPWRVPELGEILGRWQAYKRAEGFWNTVFIENHDQARSVSRFGDDGTPAARTLTAKLLALLQITQSGTIYVYQGEELGLANFSLSWGIEEYKDVASQNYWNKVLEQRRKDAGDVDVDMSDVLAGFQRKARDHARTPMQWTSETHAGFTTGPTTWMRVNDDYKTWNAANETDDEDSVLHFWKKALSLRKRHDILIYGDFQHLTPEHEQVFAYTRSLESPKSRLLVVLNFKNEGVSYSLDTGVSREGLKLLVGNYPSPPENLDGGNVELRPYEGRVYLGE